LTALRRGAQRSTAARPTSTPEVEAPVAIDRWERELIELLLLAPDVLAEVLRVVRPEQFAVGPLRELFSRACVLSAAGRPPSFAELMADIEAPELKCVLVDLDECAHRKQHVDAAALVRQVLDSFCRRQEGRQLRQHAHALREGRLDEERGLELLNQRIESGRSRQGISAPTDG
jgi:replicative DNA helicase